MYESVNGHRLPVLLCNLLQKGSWNPPKDKNKLKEVLKLHIEASPSLMEFVDYADFTTYSFELMESETAGMKDWCKSPDLSRLMLGKQDRNIFPGDLDINQAVLIADLGIGSEIPFALDYRNTAEEPCVAVLAWGKNPGQANYWVKIADTFGAFAEDIGLFP